jgi:hypothetical protein
MCLLVTLLLLGPRAAIIVYWLAWPARWEVAFDSFIVPFIGFLVLPWTTLMYVFAAPGGVDGFDWFMVGLGVVADIASLARSGTYGRSRYGQPQYG